MFGYLWESPQWDDSNRIHSIMFYEEIRIEHGLSYISFCPLRVLYNSKFILMATAFGKKCCRCNEGSLYKIVWATTWENVTSHMFAHRRLKSGCASAQSDHNLRCPREETLLLWLSERRPVKILIRLRACAVWSEFSLSTDIGRYVFWRRSAYYFQSLMAHFGTVHSSCHFYSKYWYQNMLCFPYFNTKVVFLWSFQKYNRWYPGEDATITKHSPPEASKEGEMRNTYGQHRRHIWNYRRT